MSGEIESGIRTAGADRTCDAGREACGSASFIRVLGAGGFRNCGIPYNSFLIDDRILLETPPDILQSLHREKVDPEKIHTVVVTHFHGDHCFGLPFFLFNYEFACVGRPPRRLRLAGPAGIAAKTAELLALAIHPDSRYLHRFSEHVDVVEIADGSSLALPDGRALHFHSVLHDPENYAVALVSGGPAPDFLYISDTRWGPRIGSLFEMGARVVFCDANGSDGDEDFHMSASQIAALGLPRAAGRSAVYAGHLACERNARIPGIRFLSAGDTVRL